ncbi:MULTISPECIES: hypothetical protein [unclassified Microcoleus]|uniref:hypothetical protein n=1 Tax=unclassified Microcoleus TaxID=2642155 RepID=UPI002FD0BFAE
MIFPNPVASELILPTAVGACEAEPSGHGSAVSLQLIGPCLHPIEGEQLFWGRETALPCPPLLIGFNFNQHAAKKLIPWLKKLSRRKSPR